MSYLKIIRPFNLFMIFVTQFISKASLNFAAPPNLQLPLLEFIILTIATICIAAGGYVINDIFDVRPDHINKPKEVYISVTISKKKGIVYYGFLTTIGIILGCSLAFYKSLSHHSWLFIGASALLFLYSWKLQRFAIVGNLITSILVGFSLYIVWTFTNTESTYLSPLFKSILILSISLNFLREIIKDVQDMKGDYASDYKTLPILIGTKRTLSVCTFISLSILFCTSLFTFTFFRTEYIFMVLVLLCIIIPLGIVASKCWNASTVSDFKNISRVLKLIMLLGISITPLILYLQHNA